MFGFSMPLSTLGSGGSSQGDPFWPRSHVLQLSFQGHLKLKSFILSQVTQQAKRHQGPQPLGLQHALEYLGDRHSGSI